MVTVKLGLVCSKNKLVFLKAAARNKISDVFNHRNLQIPYLVFHQMVVGIV